VTLDQINTTENTLNGRQCALLHHIPITGESKTINFIKIQFRQLCGGWINELTLRVLDDTNTDISALCKPFSATPRIKKQP
jgi:hypothetical protein